MAKKAPAQSPSPSTPVGNKPSASFDPNTLYFNEPLPVKWSTEDVVLKSLDNYVVTIKYANIKEGLAYVKRSMGFSGYFKIYINDKFTDKVLRTGLVIHEAGHIRFGHMNNLETGAKLLKSKIRVMWPKISSLVDIGPDFTKEEAIDLIANSIANKVMDMEVNSKTYSDPEFLVLQKYLSDSYLSESLAIKDINEKDEVLYNLEKNKNEWDADPKNAGKPFMLVRLVDPLDFGFPQKLTSVEYEVLALNDITKFIQKMVKMYAPAGSSASGKIGKSSGQGQGQGQGSGSGSGSGSNLGKSPNAGNSGNGGSGQSSGSNGNQQSQGNGSGGQDPNGQGQGQNNGGQDPNGPTGNQDSYSMKPGQKISKSDLEDSNDASGMNKDCLGKDDDFPVDDNNQPIDQDDNNFTDAYGSPGQGGNGRGLGHESDRLNYQVSKEEKGIKALSNFILDRSRKIKYDLSRDYMHNYNRRKYSSDIHQTLVPITKKKIRSSTTNNVFLCDVSGSMDGELLLRICKSIIDLKEDLLSKDQRIIQWDTNLVKDEDIIHFTGMSNRGGTDLASGISYASKYLKKNSDILFILSDLEDSLDEWEKEAKKLSCTVYAINVCASGQEDYDMFKKIIPYNLFRNVND